MRKKLLLSLLLLIGATATSFAAAGYCTPTTSGGPGDWNIARVLLTGSNGTLDSTGGASTNGPSYYDYFSGAFVPVLVSGTQYTISIQIGPHSFGDVDVAAWIDFNGDQIFTSGEKLGQTDSMAADAVTSFIFTGTTSAARLRVMSLHSQTTFDPCYSGSNAGETEDYDINARYIAALVGGGKRYVAPVDNCPDGDTSPTQYDGLCAGMSSSNGVVVGAVTTGTSTTGATSVSGTVQTNTQMTTGSSDTGMNQEENPEVITPVMTWSDTNACPDKEIEDAYLFAHENSITTMDTCVKARTNDFLTRAEVAKMIVNYTLNVRHIASPEIDGTCTFSDMTGKDLDTQGYARAACQLGIMGLKGDGTPSQTFNPNGLIDKAQFATMLSRMIYGSTYNQEGNAWYQGHVDKLKADGVITITSDLTSPLPRGWAMLMLMRLTDTLGV